MVIDIWLIYLSGSYHAQLRDEEPRQTAGLAKRVPSYSHSVPFLPLSQCHGEIDLFYHFTIET
jgi:hypothetical protein